MRETNGNKNPRMHHVVLLLFNFSARIKQMIANIILNENWQIKN